MRFDVVGLAAWNASALSTMDENAEPTVQTDSTEHRQPNNVVVVAGFVMVFLFLVDVGDEVVGIVWSGVISAILQIYELFDVLFCSVLGDC